MEEIIQEQQVSEPGKKFEPKPTKAEITFQKMQEKMVCILVIICLS